MLVQKYASKTFLNKGLVLSMSRGIINDLVNHSMTVILLVVTIIVLSGVGAGGQLGGGRRWED